MAAPREPRCWRLPDFPVDIPRILSLESFKYWGWMPSCLRVLGIAFCIWCLCVFVSNDIPVATSGSSTHVFTCFYLCLLMWHASHVCCTYSSWHAVHFFSGLAVKQSVYCHVRATVFEVTQGRQHSKQTKLLGLCVTQTQQLTALDMQRQCIVFTLSATFWSFLLKLLCSGRISPIYKLV